jgi:ABC-type nickel/cobalt efflux system permease component RcnA
MAGFFTYLMALLHDPTAEFMLLLVVAVVQLAVALLKTASGVFAVLAAALSLAAACAARRQNTRPTRQVKRLRVQQHRRSRAARTHRTATVRDSTPTGGGQAPQRRQQSQRLEYGAGDPEGEL